MAFKQLLTAEFTNSKIVQNILMSTAIFKEIILKCNTYSHYPDMTKFLFFASFFIFKKSHLQLNTIQPPAIFLYIFLPLINKQMVT